MKSAIGYIRVSTDDQNSSVEAQTQKIKEYCQYYHLELSEIIIDESISGATSISDRTGGGKLTSLINEKKISDVVAVKLDRLFRNASDALATCDKWEKQSCALHLIDMGGTSMNTATAIGKMMLTMLAGFAEFERNMIAERTSNVLQHKKRNMQVYHKYVPYGFKKNMSNLTSTRDKGMLEVDASNMAVVNRIFMLRNLHISYENICWNLNKDNIPSPLGGTWGKSTLFTIANNPIYKNYVESIK